MSAHFFIDRAGSADSDDWHVPTGTLQWALEVIAEHVRDPGLRDELVGLAAFRPGMVVLSNFGEENAADIVRVIRGPLAETAAEHKSEELHEMIDELAGMATRWEERRQQGS
ncbi:hypothetical protein [Saccharothrix variisporea]|uniref:Uncharacterized protein n=1 Tax=Saccharothrix variisporea TaxID=543527 RepID=A0A495X717_9PSEU|nr:hypothetical protein [Saccharothrix variisporea]RKT69266.1 hypothetical protein DFJ66_2469 [Saccharothrix variisporea]